MYCPFDKRIATVQQGVLNICFLHVGTRALVRFKILFTKVTLIMLCEKGQYLANMSHLGQNLTLQYLQHEKTKCSKPPETPCFHLRNIHKLGEPILIYRRCSDTSKIEVC